MEQKLTTDYAIAIESLSNGTAQIGCCMGGEGYCQAKMANDAVNPLFVQSGESGTLDDALYYSFFCSTGSRCCDLEMAPYATCIDGTANEAGSADATAPFDTVQGEKYTVIQSTPVLNGSFAYNGDTLSSEDVKAIQDLFTSDEVANDSRIFYSKDSGEQGLYEKKSDAMCFLTVDDAWYDPIRNMQS